MHTTEEDRGKYLADRIGQLKDTRQLLTERLDAIDAATHQDAGAYDHPQDDNSHDNEQAPDRASQGDSQETTAPLKGERAAVQERLDQTSEVLTALEKERETPDSGRASSTPSYEMQAQFGDPTLSYDAPVENDQGKGTGTSTSEQALGAQLIQAAYKVSDQQESDVQRLGKAAMTMTPQGDAAFGIGNIPMDHASAVALGTGIAAAVAVDYGRNIARSVEGLKTLSDERVNEAIEQHQSPESTVRDNAVTAEVEQADAAKHESARARKDAAVQDQASDKPAPATQRESDNDIIADAERDQAQKFAASPNTRPGTIAPPQDRVAAPNAGSPSGIPSTDRTAASLAASPPHPANDNRGPANDNERDR